MLPRAQSLLFEPNSPESAQFRRAPEFWQKCLIAVLLQRLDSRFGAWLLGQRGTRGMWPCASSH